MCTRAEKDAIAAAIGWLPVHRRLRHDAVPAGPARHRRAPRRHAAQVPPAGGDAGPGRPAQGHLRHGHPRRRHQRARSAPCCSPACPSTTGSEDPAAEGPRVPPDRRPGRAGRVRHPRHRRRAGPRARHRQRAVPWPRPATTRRSAARWSARSRRRASSAGASPPSTGWSTADPEPLTSQLPGQPRDAAQRAGPRRRRVRGDAAPADRQPRGAGRPAPAHPPGRSRSPGRCSPAGSIERARAGRGRPSVPADRSTCSWTSRSTSRCRRSRWPAWSCSTGSRRTTRWTWCR